MEAIDKGFEFIEKSFRDRVAPASGIAQVRWVSRQLHDPNCPLYANGEHKWTEKIVEKVSRPSCWTGQKITCICSAV